MRCVCVFIAKRKGKKTFTHQVKSQNTNRVNYHKPFMVRVSCFEAPSADIVVCSVCVCVQTESVHMCMFLYVSRTVYVLSYFWETHICEPAHINAVCVCVDVNTYFMPMGSFECMFARATCSLQQ